MVERIEHIVGQTAEQIDDEPRLQIVDAYHLWIADHLTTGPHKRSVEI